MATFKHISSKNADYGAAEAYLTFEHDEFTILADFSHDFITQPLGLLMQSGALCFQRVVAGKLRLRCYPAI